MKQSKFGTGRWKKAVTIAMVSLALARAVSFPAFADPVLTEDSEEFSEDEINQILDDYFSETKEFKDTEELQFSNAVKDPVLEMEYAGKGKLRYTLPNRASFTINVPNGMITNQGVTLELPDGAVGAIQKDDGKSSFLDTRTFTEAGTYQLTLFFFQSPYASVEDYNVYEVHFHFAITGERSAGIGVVAAPDGFQIAEVVKNGVPQRVENPNCHFLTEDGVYQIHYKDRKTGQIHLESQLTRDTTAPFLSFSEDITRAAAAPLEFTSSEPGGRIIATYNGNRGQITTTTLTSAGPYTLEVYDEAGNCRIYHLTIRQTYQLIDTKVIVFAFLFLTGLCCRLWFLRRNMRVI